MVFQGACADPDLHYLIEPEPFRAEVRVSADYPLDAAGELLHMVGFELVQVEPAQAQVSVYGWGVGCERPRELAYTGTCGAIWVCKPPTPQVLAHEIGHAVGAQHVPNSEGPAIMNPEIGAAQRMTELDADAFRNRVLAGSIFDPECGLLP